MSNMRPAFIESDIERDRKECVRLDLKVSGANRELAEWVANHSYSNVEVAGWLTCNESRIRKLRKWAKEGFVGFYDKTHPTKSPQSPSTANQPLKSKDNSIPSEEEAEESYQETLFEQACLFLEDMTDKTRQRFFAKLRGEYGYAA
jgi:hypothetical protein